MPLFRLLLLVALAAYALAAESAAKPGTTAIPLWVEVPAAVRALPVLHSGRVKPFATAAEEIVTAIAGRPAIAVEVDGATHRLSAESALLSWLAAPAAWSHRAIIAVPWLELRQVVGAPYGLATIAQARAATPQMRAAFAKREILSGGRRVDWLPIDEAALQLAGRLGEAQDALDGGAFQLIPLLAGTAAADWAKAQTGGRWRERIAAQAGWDADAWLRADPWLSLGECADPSLSTAPQPIAAGVQTAATWLEALRAGDAPALESASLALTTALHAAGAAHTSFQRASGALAPADYPSTAGIAGELAYRAARPFTWAWVLFVLGAAATGWALARAPSPWWWRLGVGLTAAGCAVSAAGLATRFALTGWGAVTNLYETVVYVGFLVGLLGLALAWLGRSPLYVVAAGIGAALCAIVGEAMPPDLGSHIGQLQPVLRSRLWLSVHVKVVVASYAPFLLAWVLGNIILWRAWRSGRAATADDAAVIYRCLQIGVVLIATGTLLGGVWAAQSWGRFWGWDPKEVWALVILLTYLVPLHLRYAGLVGPTGLAVWAVFGFLSVVMSWYGVNFLLGAGLHAYATGRGFGNGGEWYVLPLVAGQCLLTTWQAVALRQRALAGQSSPG